MQMNRVNVSCRSSMHTVDEDKVVGEAEPVMPLPFPSLLALSSSLPVDSSSDLSSQ